MEKRKCLARGRTAEIYEWDPGRVLKLFFDWVSPAWIELEINAAQVVQQTNLPVPRFFDTVIVENRRGLIYERLDGITLGDEFNSHPLKLFALARLLAELHAAMHHQTVTALPAQRALLEPMIRASAQLTPESKTRVLNALHTLPDGNVLCHHDFHAGNILLTARGPIIIDWMSAGYGNPDADVARTLLLARLNLPRRWLASIRIRLAIRIYLQRYLELRKTTLKEIKAWLLPIAAARTNEEIPEERDRLNEIIRAEIQSA